VAFLAAQVWGDLDRAKTAVNREASALRTVVILSDSFPDAKASLRTLIRQHIQDAQATEWPAMAHRQATITIIPAALAQLMRTTFALPVEGASQVAAQREIILALEDAAEARRQRILISQSEVNFVKWANLLVQAICTLIAVGMVHSDNRSASAIAMGLFSTAIAVCIFMIMAHDRPFIGQNAVQPTVLLQVQPDAEAESTAR